jgi:hypothetical protein
VNLPRAPSGIKDFRINDARHLHAEQFAERPAGIVIRRFLDHPGSILVIESASAMRE